MKEKNITLSDYQIQIVNGEVVLVKDTKSETYQKKQEMKQRMGEH